jgi:putative GTP pyrophosphokinase
MKAKDNLTEEYKEKEFIYGRISVYMNVELYDLLHIEKIPYLTITSRIKTLESFNEKIERKGYIDPFDQVEDFCGFRIICYYRSDVIRISKLLEKNFEVLESFNKEDLLKENEFGYRSYHMIAKIPKGRSPNLIDDSFSDYKFEIQIRTVLMHAWAEIQHKLAYKSKSQIALSMRKEFAFLSAKLEESDFQFERLKNESDRIQNQFRDKIDREGIDKVDELNLYSLRAVLESKFPNRKEDLDGISRLLDQLKESQINLKMAFKAYEKAENFILNTLEKEKQFFTRSGVLRTALNLLHDKFWNNYVKTVDMEKYSNWVKEREEQREYVKKITSD